MHAARFRVACNNTLQRARGVSDSGQSYWTISQITFSFPKLKHGIEVVVSLKKGRLVWQRAMALQSETPRVKV